MDTAERTSITERIINGLRKAAIELEEFQVQAALGKAEARDAYEGAKSIFNKYVHEAKVKIERGQHAAGGKTDLLRSAFEALQVQLALGKAETKEMFEIQLKKINRALRETEALISRNKTTEFYYAELQMEIEKFRIKLEILELQYELKKLGVREEFETRKKEFSKILTDIKNNLLKKETQAEAGWRHFQEEISEAYSHLKKVFTR